MIYVRSILTGLAVAILTPLIERIWGGDIYPDAFWTVTIAGVPLRPLDSIVTTLIVSLVLVWHYRRAH